MVDSPRSIRKAIEICGKDVAADMTNTEILAAIDSRLHAFDLAMAKSSSLTTGESLTEENIRKLFANIQSRLKTIKDRKPTRHEEEDLECIQMVFDYMRDMYDATKTKQTAASCQKKESVIKHLLPCAQSCSSMSVAGENKLSVAESRKRKRKNVDQLLNETDKSASVEPVSLRVDQLGES